MTTNLMTPRYLVIADYPLMRCKLGEILEADMTLTADILATKEYDKYPHLFRPLSWWEFREEKDMPEYVKVHGNEIHKVRKWNIFRGHAIANTLDGTTQYDFNASECIPSTATEYEQFKNK